MAGQNEKTCGVSVQTVDDAIHKRFFLLSEIPGHAVGQGHVIVALRGMNGKSGWFVYNQDRKSVV